MLHALHGIFHKYRVQNTRTHTIVMGGSMCKTIVMGGSMCKFTASKEAALQYITSQYVTLGHVCLFLS